MNSFKRAVFGVVVCSVAMAAHSKVHLAGKIVDETGTPVVNATMKLGKNPTVTMSDAEGKFDFGDSIVAIHSKRATISQVGLCVTSRGVTFTVLENTSPVKVELFNLAGKKVRTLLDGALVPDRYTVPFSGLTNASAAYVVRVHIGSSVYTSEMIATGAGALHGNFPSISVSGGITAEVNDDADIIDSVYSFADGYENGYFPLTTYETDNVQITVQTADNIAPVIKILGGDTVFVAIGDDAGRLKYWDPTNLQIEVTDNKSPADKIIIPAPTQTSIDPTVSGFHEIEYKAIDEASNTGYAVRLLILVDSTVTDNEPPVITLSPDTVKLVKGELYNDTGITITDAVDSHIDLIDWVKRTGSILDNKAGRYTYYTYDAGTFTETYEIIDTHNNRATKTRVIIVSEQ